MWNCESLNRIDLELCYWNYNEYAWGAVIYTSVNVLETEIQINKCGYIYKMTVGPGTTSGWLGQK
jgi:hypothetical protein